MGLRQNKLKEIIHKHFGVGSFRRPNPNEIVRSESFELIKNTYKKLGGTLDIPPLRFGLWDICAGEYILELDEERHFNRYRLITLSHDHYNNQFNSFNVDAYKAYCTDKEVLCLKAARWGGNWKTNSTECQFLKSDLEGQLEGSGSSRWRQRAYYDFVKDAAVSIIRIPFFRLSIYDQVDEKSLGEVLESTNVNEVSILNYVRARVEY